MKAQLIKEAEIQEVKEKLPEWTFSGTSIKREFQFINFLEAFAFITKVAIIAEGINHHPNWSNVYSTVKIELTTHDLGGISNLDIDLATSIEKSFSG
tara:strand:- start:601 stop:891 length:291 start_codon:yes stop_codon:yes gene_type:complete